MHRSCRRRSRARGSRFLIGWFCSRRGCGFRSRAGGLRPGSIIYCVIDLLVHRRGVCTTSGRNHGVVGVVGRFGLFGGTDDVDDISPIGRLAFRWGVGTHVLRELHQAELRIGGIVDVCGGGVHVPGHRIIATVSGQQCGCIGVEQPCGHRARPTWCEIFRLKRHECFRGFAGIDASACLDDVHFCRLVAGERAPLFTTSDFDGTFWAAESALRVGDQRQQRCTAVDSACGTQLGQSFLPLTCVVRRYSCGFTDQSDPGGAFPRCTCVSKRQLRIGIEQLSDHHQVTRHPICVRLVQRQQIPTDFLVEIRRHDVVGQRRTRRPTLRAPPVRTTSIRRASSPVRPSSATVRPTPAASSVLSPIAIVHDSQSMPCGVLVRNPQRPGAPA